MSISNELSVAGPDDGVLYLEQYHPNFLWVLALAFPVLPLFWNYHVRVTKEIVSFGYSTNIVAKTVDRSSITSVEPFEINPLSGWGGWGIRVVGGHADAGGGRERYQHINDIEHIVEQTPHDHIVILGADTQEQLGLGTSNSFR